MIEYTFNGENWTSCCVSFRHTFSPSSILVYLASSMPQYLNLQKFGNIHIPANTILLNIEDSDVSSLVAEGIFKVATKEDCQRIGRGICL